MQSVIKISGRQYMVKPGDEIIVDKITNSGEPIELQDLLSGKKIMAKIIGDVLSDKINIIKFHAKKRYLKRLGHRQLMTKIQIYE